MSRTPTYDALPVDQRLTIERLLYTRLTGVEYTERSIPDDASDKKKEYLVSCVRDAVHRIQEGPIPPHHINPTREMTARTGIQADAVRLVTPADLREIIAAAMIAAAKRVPYDLDLLQREAQDQLRRASQGESVPGIGKLSALGVEKGIPRRKIAERHLGALGYEYMKARSGSGSLGFSKRLPSGAVGLMMMSR